VVSPPGGHACVQNYYKFPFQFPIYESALASINLLDWLDKKTAARLCFCVRNYSLRNLSPIAQTLFMLMPPLVKFDIIWMKVNFRKQNKSATRRENRWFLLAQRTQLFTSVHAQVSAGHVHMMINKSRTQTQNTASCRFPQIPINNAARSTQNLCCFRGTNQHSLPLCAARQLPKKQCDYIWAHIIYRIYCCWFGGAALVWRRAGSKTIKSEPRQRKRQQQEKFSLLGSQAY
jgi:hypothetical protein